MIYKINAPNTEYNGEFGGVRFFNGEAETSDEKMVNYFKRAGYSVEELKVADKGTKGKDKGKKAEDEPKLNEGP